jgi:hypothetical protein
MKFRDRKHQLAVQMAERADPTAQSLLREFCELINLPYQQQQGLFAVGYYTSFLKMRRATQGEEGVTSPAASDQPESAEQPSPEISSGEEPVAEAGSTAGENEEAVEPGSSPDAAVESDAAEIAEGTPAPEMEPAAPEGEERTPVNEIPETENAESNNGEPAAPESNGESNEAEQLAAELGTPADNAADDSQTDASVADETAVPLGLIGLDDGNEDSLKHDGGEETPLESEGIDAESVFLGMAEEDPEHPGEIRPLEGDDDEEVHRQRPHFPSNS